MDLRTIGNMFMIGFQGTRVDSELLELIDELNPAGVILFARNIEDPRQLATLNRDLQRFALDRLTSGLLIGVDQEGGRVRRLREPFSEFPPAYELASSSDPTGSVRGFAERTALELRLVGFNLDFVPVVDVLTGAEELGSSVIGDRSFGADPQTVAHLGTVVAQVMRNHGVIPCCKHFPGHGGTSTDSHLELPYDDRSARMLRDRDLVPYSQAIDQGIEMIMTAHVLFPMLDSTLPATLSPAIVHGMLRLEMGYEGVIVTDDLNMGAVADNYSCEQSVEMAIHAGVDLLLICDNPSKAFAARNRVAKAIREGTLSSSRIRESNKRIAALKSRFTDSMRPCDPEAVTNYFRTQSMEGIHEA